MRVTNNLQFVITLIKKGIFMITLKVEKENRELNQDYYDLIIRNIEIHSLECTCGRHDMVVHSYYSRNIKTESGVIKLDILRVKCKECGKTHAVLLSLIVPYQSVELGIQIQILKDEDVDALMVNNEAIDELEVYRIRNRFKTKYKKWMSLNKLSFLDDLVKLAFRDFKSNFMQIRKGCYNLV